MASSTKRRAGIGRGLSAILPETPADAATGELREQFAGIVFETVIPRSVRVAESPSYGLPVTDHAPSSRGSLAYHALAKELAARG